MHILTLWALMQRKKLLRASQDERTSSIDKLASYLGSIQSCLRLGYVSLHVYSRTLGMQTSLCSAGANPFSPTPGQSVPSYSVAHQVSEIVGDDPDEKVTQFSTDLAAVPDDLAALGQQEVRASEHCAACLRRNLQLVSDTSRE